MESGGQHVCNGLHVNLPENRLKGSNKRKHNESCSSAARVAKVARPYYIELFQFEELISKHTVEHDEIPSDLEINTELAMFIECGPFE